MSEVNLAVGSVRVMRSLDIEDGEKKLRQKMTDLGQKCQNK